MPVLDDSCAQQPKTPLEQYAVGGLNGLFYIPNYLEPCQQRSLLENIQSSKSRWTQVSGRKLQSFGGTVHEKWGGLLQAPLPTWLKPLLTKLEHSFQLYEGSPNHVLLNVYEPGQGILAHEDGPVYFPAASIIGLGSSAVMNFRRKSSEGQPSCLQILCTPDCSMLCLRPYDNYAKGIDPQPCASVLLMPGSLLVFSHDAYTTCLHDIAQVSEDLLDSSILNLEQCGRAAGCSMPRGLRQSLTIRRVLKVKSLVRLPGQRK